MLLAIAWLVPFAVHLIPWAGARPLGAYLMPMFWTAFVAAYFYGARVGLLVGLFAPVTNEIVTGLPEWKSLMVPCVELVVFVFAVTLVVRRWPRFILLAPLGYLAAKLLSTVLRFVSSEFSDVGACVTHFVNSSARTWTGLIALMLINAALVKFYPKQSETKAAR